MLQQWIGMGLQCVLVGKRSARAHPVCTPGTWHAAETNIGCRTPYQRVHRELVQFNLCTLAKLHFVCRAFPCACQSCGIMSILIWEAQTEPGLVTKMLIQCLYQQNLDI